MPPLVSSGLILFAHGARDPAWARPIEVIREQIQTRHPALPVRVAYLEFLPPDLAVCMAEFVQMGLRKTRILPMFMATAGHLARDLPQQVSLLRASYPAMDIQIELPVGEQPDIQAAIVQMTSQWLTPSHLVGGLFCPEESEGLGSSSKA